MRPRTLLIPAALGAWSLAAAPAAAQFSGDLAFMPDACRAENQCILKSPLTFVDHARRTWQADAGAITDGASIPDWAQGVIGGRWDESFLKAAVLHDQYCGNMKYSWKETHLMFYEALLELGVSSFKAKVMYYAVYLGGPKWEGALKCDPSAGDACLMGSDPDGVKMVVRPERYDSIDMHREMAAAEDYMAKNPQASLEDLEAMARRARPDDDVLKADGEANRPRTPERP